MCVTCQAEKDFMIPFPSFLSSDVKLAEQEARRLFQGVRYACTLIPGMGFCANSSVVSAFVVFLVDRG